MLDVLVHIDPEDDRDYVGSGIAIPVRSELIDAIGIMLGGLAPPARITLHYLGGRVEADLDYASADLPMPLDALQARLDSARLAFPVFVSVRPRLVMHR